MASQTPFYAEAIQLFLRGDYPQAVALLQKAVAANPAHLESRLQLVKASFDWVQAQAQKPLADVEPDTLSAEAMHYLQLAQGQLNVLAKTHPSSPHVQSMLGMLHLIYSRPSEALGCFKKAQAKDAKNADLLFNIGYSLMELERYSEAVNQFARLTKLYPDHAMGWHMLGEAARKAGDPEAAIPAHRHAINLQPNWYKPYGGLASSLKRLGRFAEAMEVLQQAVKIDPNIDLYFPIASLALSTGNWIEGWRYYACRSSDRQHLPFPEGHVIPLKPGEPVRVHYDQGLGDELFFLRFLPVLVARGMSIDYTTHRKLFPLLKGRKDIHLLKVAEPDQPKTYDVLVGDLPYLAGMNSKDEIPPPLALTPDEELVKPLREQLTNFGPPPYLGLTWLGGTPKAPGRKGVWRSLFKEISPALLGKLARNWPGTVIVMQRLPKPEDLTIFSKALGRPYLDWSNLNDELPEVLAGLSLLDEYVGVSNTNMHLLAGLGKTARVLLPNPAEWRWMAEGDESPWFPGFALYRQPSSKDWNKVVEKLGKDLSEKYQYSK